MKYYLVRSETGVFHVVVAGREMSLCRRMAGDWIVTARQFPLESVVCELCKARYAKLLHLTALTSPRRSLSHD